MGTIEHPINPIGLALAAEASFCGALHRCPHPTPGRSPVTGSQSRRFVFVEVYQNCVIFNPNEWVGLDDRCTRDDNILYLEHGKPMVFGKNHDRGIRLNGFTPEVVDLATVSLRLIWSSTTPNRPNWATS